MNFSSFTIVMLCALTVAVLGVLYVRRTQLTALKHREKRKELLRQVESQPLPRMLQALGIGIGRYLYQQPVDAVEDSIALCKTCETKPECEQKLRIPELNPEDIEFCDNRENLAPFSRAKRIREQQ